MYILRTCTRTLYVLTSAAIAQLLDAACACARVHIARVHINSNVSTSPKRHSGQENTLRDYCGATTTFHAKPLQLQNSIKSIVIETVRMLAADINTQH